MAHPVHQFFLIASKADKALAGADVNSRGSRQTITATLVEIPGG